MKTELEMLDEICAYEAGEMDHDDEAVMMQRLINLGQWSFQGSYGRAMMDAIESGRCMLGMRAARDYWGNIIPARDMVQPGTKGSREYVAERMGEGWAEMLEGV